MAPKTCTLLYPYGPAVSELLARSRARYGPATMMADDPPADDGKGGKGKDDGKPADKDKAKDDDGEPTEEELAALGDAGRRALERVKAERNRLREEHAAAAEKARKYDELEEANKTEQQKRDEAAAEAAKRAETSELKLAKLEAALEAGLPHTAAARLVGTTPAELKKDAEAYKAELESATPQRQRRTTSDADKGGDGPTGGMSTLIRRAAGRQA